MRKRDIRMDYRGWKFRDKVPLIPKDRQWKAYFDAKFDGIDVDVDIDFDEDGIKECIENTAETLSQSIDDKLCNVHKHIEEAKDHLCCDICCARKDIKKHIDDTFDAIGFEEQFSNLNEQAQTIIEKLNNI